MFHAGPSFVCPVSVICSGLRGGSGYFLALGFLRRASVLALY